MNYISSFFNWLTGFGRSVVNERENKGETYLELGNNELLRIKVKKLNPIEYALNYLLKDINQNFWVPYKNGFLSVHQLSKYEPSCNAYQIRKIDVEKFIETTKKNVKLAQLIVETTKSKFNNTDFKLIRKIQSLPSKNAIVSYSKIVNNQKIKFLIAGDHSTYALENQIGNGTFKTTCQGKTLFSPEKVAILEIDIGDEDKRIACERELTILEKLKNIPGIVQLKSTYTKKNKKILIEELCDGGPLLTHLENLGNAERVNICLQILKIIDQIHEKGFIYGDLKPQNFLLKKDSETQQLLVRFGDFGFSHEKGNKPLGGSFFYMSPERLSWLVELDEKDQLLDESAQVKSEIFEMGLIIIELLLAKMDHDHPFPWCERIEMLINVYEVKDDPNELRQCYKELKDCMIKRFKDLEKSINMKNRAAAQAYRIIIAMLNVENPNDRPSLSEVIEKFEKYEEFLKYASLNSGALPEISLGKTLNGK